MDKFEDAFKKISKVNLATHIELWGEPKTEKLYFEAGQQSRQAELDQLNEVLYERTKEWLEAIELGTYFQDVAKPLKDEINQLQSQINEMAEVGLNQESVIREKDKRIESQSNCIENLVVQKSDYLNKVTKAIAHLDSFDHSKACINKLQRSIKCALEALRGEHE